MSKSPQLKIRRMSQTTIIILIAVAGILSVVLTAILNFRQGKEGSERHKQVLDKSDSNSTQVKSHVTQEFDSLKKHEAAKEIIIVSPEQIVLPAKSNRDLPIIITNNRPYPVFMTILTMDVVEGKINLNEDCQILPLMSGTMFVTHRSFQLPPIAAKGTFQIIMRIKGGKYDKASKIKLAVPKYMKEPEANFSMDGMDSLPQTISVPKDFVPEMLENK